jgi:uncharacterized membrane protein YfcA
MTLLFRISEKVATPTTIVLMATNSAIGFYWRQLMMSSISNLAWEYFAVCIPVVTVFAPFGSLLASHFHRLVLATAIYILECLALIGFLITRPEWQLIAIGAIIIAGFFVFFSIISRIGEKMANDVITAAAAAPDDIKKEIKINDNLVDDTKDIKCISSYV